MAEMTPSLRVDLVMSDTATPASHNLFNLCCHFVYGDATMWLKCIWHSKNARFTQYFVMSATPGNILLIMIMNTDHRSVIYTILHIYSIYIYV